MKNKILLVAGLMAALAVPVRAELTVGDTSSDTYLKNHGHSQATIDIVNLQKSNASGENFDLPVYHKYDNKPAIYKWIDKFFIYMDPALDDGQFLRQDTKFVPNPDDL